MENNSYITILSTENYLSGVLCLIESLRNTNTKYPITVLITDDISKDTETFLKSYGLNVIRKNSIDIPKNIKKKNSNGSFTHWNNTFDKLIIFELIEFDKLVYLDSDMYIKNNIDELFQKKHMTGTADRPIGPITDPNRKKMITSGIMVIEPKKGIMEEFFKIIENISDKRESIGDQDILQEYDKHWYEKCELHLDVKYNMFYPHIDYYTNYLNYKLKDINVVHFIFGKKPFHIKREEIEQYIEFIENGKKELYKKHKERVPYEYLTVGYNDEKTILLEYFQILEKVRKQIDK